MFSYAVDWETYHSLPQKSQVIHQWLHQDTASPPTLHGWIGDLYVMGTVPTQEE